MTSKIDFSKVIDIAQMKGETEEETPELLNMWHEASNFLVSFPWCWGFKETYFGMGYPGIVAVFLVKILPDKEWVDEWLWVIVGDLPPAYIVTDNAPNPATALDAYIGKMTLWIEAARNNKPVYDLIPVNVPATPENAIELEERLDFIDTEILVYYKDDLNF